MRCRIDLFRHKRMAVLKEVVDNGATGGRFRDSWESKHEVTVA